VREERLGESRGREVHAAGVQVRVEQARDDPAAAELQAPGVGSRGSRRPVRHHLRDRSVANEHVDRPGRRGRGDGHQARAAQQIDLAHAQAAIAANAGEMQAWADAIKGQSTPTGVKWADALSATVRPVLTYWWCLLLYTACKGVTIWAAWQAHTPLAGLATILVTEFDTAVIGSVFSFWFVDRAIRKQTAQ